MDDEEPNRAHTLRAIEPPGQDPLIGRLLEERYRVGSRLGAGGMGIVYHASHEVLGTRLAIKVLHPDAAGDDEAVERLRREAQAASAIGSPHIVDVRDFGTLDDGSTYVVMELIDGTDLYAMVQTAPLAWARVRDIALQLCEALGAAHDAGIVHRDLKLENVLLTTRAGTPDFVKIVDFGIALVQGSAKLTVAGRVIGTPEYMSPEQCSGRTVDHRTDIYSLGVMLYEMVTGKLPFYDSDLAKLVRMQMHERPVAPSAVRPEAELPLAFEAVILRCLAKDPAARYPTMQAIAEDLRAIDVPGAAAPAPFVDPSAALDAGADSGEEAPAPIVVGPRTTGRGGAPPRGRWIVPAVLVLGAFIAGAAWMMRPDPNDDSAMRASQPASSEPADRPGADRADTDRDPDRADTDRADTDRADTDRSSVVEPGVPARSAEITLDSVPSGARVFNTEGALLGETPFRVVRPGPGERIALSLRADGFEPHPVALSHQSAEQLRLVLERRAGPVRRAAPGEGTPSGEPAGDPPRDRRGRARSHQEFLDPWHNEP